jgi:hypothetical protein
MTAWEQLQSTTNFQYYFDPAVPDADVRAAALLESSESDLDRLEASFGVTGGFGEGHRIRGCS